MFRIYKMLFKRQRLKMMDSISCTSRRTSTASTKSLMHQLRRLRCTEVERQLLTQAWRKWFLILLCWGRLLSSRAKCKQTLSLIHLLKPLWTRRRLWTVIIRRSLTQEEKTNWASKSDQTRSVFRTTWPRRLKPRTATSTPNSATWFNKEVWRSNSIKWIILSPRRASLLTPWRLLIRERAAPNLAVLLSTLTFVALLKNLWVRIQARASLASELPWEHKHMSQHLWK